MKAEVILYVANVKINNLMEAVDLKPGYKWYVQPVSAEIDMDDTSIEKLTQALKEQMIASRGNDDFYVPAIRCGDVFIKDDGVKELSDGETTMFMAEPEEPEVVMQEKHDLGCGLIVDGLCNCTNKGAN